MSTDFHDTPFVRGYSWKKKVLPDQAQRKDTDYKIQGMCVLPCRIRYYPGKALEDRVVREVPILAAVKQSSLAFSP